MSVSKRLHGKPWLHHLITSDFNSFAKLSTDNSTTDDDSTDTASPPTKSPPSQDNNNTPNTDSTGSDTDNSSGKGNNNNDNIDNNTSPSTSPPADDNNGNKNNNNNSNNNKSVPRNSRDPSSPPPPKTGRPMITPPPRFQKAVRNGDSSSKQEETEKIVGGIVGVGALLLLIILILVCCLCKKRKKEKHYSNTMKYMPHDNKDGAGQQQYYGNNTQWQENQQHNQVGNYSTATGMPSQQSWPPPPPMGMNSEMMSTGQYSSGQAGPILPPPPPPTLGGFNKSTFTYEELALATNNFSQDNILGQGGFGYVHKGVLPNGKEIAVKSLKTGSGQGEREFQAEVEIISRVHHRYLVSLVGYCIAGGQRMLVYEYIPNGTLEYHLHVKGHPVMDFGTRMKIALGSAKGLAYLHEDCHPRIIHRDIKGANILLENNYEAKVADFGLAKLSNDTNTHVSTRIMGTFGYLAPEYAASGKLTEKSDVFSFGVMLLELVTGKRPIDPSAEEEDTLVDWARPLIPRALEEGILNGLVDPRLQGNFDIPEMTRLIACAGAAVRHSGKRRPKMSQIVRALEGDMSIDALYEPKTKVGLQSGANSEYNTEAYNKDISKFRKAILNDSTDYSSSSDHSENLKREQ